MSFDLSERLQEGNKEEITQYLFSKDMSGREASAVHFLFVYLGNSGLLNLLFLLFMR